MAHMTGIGFQHKIGIGRRKPGFKNVCVISEEATAATPKNPPLQACNSPTCFVRRSPKKDGGCCSYARRDTRVAEEQNKLCHVTRGSLRRYCGFTTQYTSRFGERDRRPDICPVHFWNSGFSV